LSSPLRGNFACFRRNRTAAAATTVSMTSAEAPLALQEIAGQSGGRVRNPSNGFVG
jgi:hypothetical protein